MDIPGRFQGGVVVLQGDASLPEGTPVHVVVDGAGVMQPLAEHQRIQLPLVHCQRPDTVNLTSERVAEILSEDDVPSRH